MAIGLVQNTHGNTFAATNPSLTISSTGSGNLLVLLLGEDQNSSRVTAVSDGTTGFTHYTAADNHDTFALFCDIWFLPNSASGKTSISVTTSAGLTAAWYVYEFSGAAVSSPTSGETPGVNIANQTPANPMNGSTCTPSNSGDVLVTIFNTTAGTRPSSVTGWSGFMSDNAGGSKPGCAAYLIPGSTSAQTPSAAGASAGGEYCSSTAAFLPAASATFVISHMEAGQMCEVGTVM